MTKSSHVRFRLFVTWNVYRVVFLPIFVFWLFEVCCLYCFWWLLSVLLRAFLCSLLVIVSIHQCYFNAGKSSSFFSWLCHLQDVRPYASSGVFLFSGLFVGVLLWSTLGTVLSILWWGQPMYLSLWWDCYVLLCPNKRQHVIYITIYIYFLDGRLCEVGAIRRGIRIVRLWGLDSSM